MKCEECGNEPCSCDVSFEPDELEDAEETCNTCGESLDDCDCDEDEDDIF